MNDSLNLDCLLVKTKAVLLELIRAFLLHQPLFYVVVINTFV